jgi:MFS family permease
VGGIVGGVLADRYGRRRTLLWTVCVRRAHRDNSVGWDWWAFALLRLLTGVALGSEWSAGTTLVSETWPDGLRSRAAVLMQRGVAVGFFVAAVMWFVLGPLGPAAWRWMFLIGIVPAVIAIAIRRRVPVSPVWAAEEDRARTQTLSGSRRMSTARRILADPGLRRITLVAGAMSLATTVGYWGVSTFVPQYFASVAVPAGWDAARATSVSGMVYTAGAVAGYLAVGFLAESWGRKPTVALLFAGALVLTPIVFLWVHTVPVLLALLFVNGALTLGQYGWMAIWLPELYPTSVRATGIALVFNASRLLACAGPLLAGSLMVALGGFGAAATTVGSVYLLGLAVVWLCTETRGQPLPQG